MQMKVCTLNFTKELITIVNSCLDAYIYAILWVIHGKIQTVATPPTFMLCKHISNLFLRRKKEANKIKHSNLGK